ncbi:MAG: hypothetical protein PCFJNLEI_03254 [Verrucomicrobiae bacterium]|nr:hypothetical protein [Verrucomicrobiae bacterium]
MKRWCVNLAVGAALLAAALAGTQTPIIDIYNDNDPHTLTNAGNYVVVGDLARLTLGLGAMNNANLVTNWNEMCTQVKIYDIYSVTNPVVLWVSDDAWQTTIVPGSATNLWDITFNCNDWIRYIRPDGDNANFSIATYVPTNAVGRLVIATRRGQGKLETLDWQPGSRLDRVGGDGYLGPVGLAEAVRPVGLGLVVAGASAVVGVSNTVAGAGYASCVRQVQ